MSNEKENNGFNVGYDRSKEGIAAQLERDKNASTQKGDAKKEAVKIGAEHFKRPNL